MTWREYLDRLAFIQLGLTDYEGPRQDEQDLLIFDRVSLKTVKIREARAWSSGDDSALQNFYSRNSAINFHLEPFYWKNKRDYFWSRSASETNYKRTTSGLCPAIEGTIINIIGIPDISDDSGTLKRMLEEDGFEEVFHDDLMPKVVSEGAGCLRISWDTDVYPHPTIDFTEAEDTDFIKRGRHTVGVAFKDWYKDRDGRRYLVAEIRLNRLCETDGGVKPCLFIIHRCFGVSEGDETQLQLLGTDLWRSMPELAGVPDDIVIENCPKLLAEPIWFWKDPEGILDGRPMLSEKRSLLDDLDQSLSQSGNASRASTVQRVYDTQFLDRDPDTGLPIRPDRFNLQYTYTDSGPTAGAEGGIRNVTPISVVQPQINFAQYSQEQMNIATHIMQGYVAPATMGIDISKKDNGTAIREKEKVTVYTRNGMIHRLEKMLKSAFYQYMVCNDYITTGGMDWSKHKDIAVKFSEFADTSFEARAGVLASMLGSHAISPKQFVKKLYLDTLTEDEMEQEIEWIDSHFSAAAEQQAMLGGAASMMMGGGQQPEDEDDDEGIPPFDPDEEAV